MPITPNMNMDLPTPGADENVWDDKINASLDIVDTHDHTPGKGIPVPSTAVEVIQDFSVASNSVIDINKTQFEPNSAVLTGTSNQRAVYAVDNDLYYTNGSGVAVQITDGSSLATAVASPALPVGTITAYGGSSAPSGWLLCDGNHVSRTTFSALFAIVGTIYGVGNGSTTFSLPNLNGRTAIGAGVYTDPVSGSLTRTIGQTIGAERHTLTTPEMPSHTHTDSGHNHPFTYTGPLPGSDAVNYRGPDAGAFRNTTTDSGFANILPTGGGGTHNNMQPSLVVNYIIKT